MSKKEPTLSLCMIVKDEEQALPVCLDSVRGVVDEIVIVDTGSQDRTVEVAKSYGAQVYHFPWCDDFSAARNESLHHATGDWILCLDADERLNSEDAHRLKELIRKLDPYPKMMAVNLRQVIPQTETGLVSYFVSDYCRLFRNCLELRFEGRVHEQILPAVQRLGGKAVKTDIRIEHWGFACSEDKRKERMERNLALLLMEVGERSQDPFVHFNLGMTYYSMGRLDEASSELRRALALDGGRMKPELMAQACFRLAQIHLVWGELEEALNQSLQAERFSPNNPLLLYLQATVYFQKGWFEGSASLLRRVMLLFAESPEGDLWRVDWAQLHLDLGNCYYRLGKLEGAQKEYREALWEDPQRWEAWYNLGNCYLTLGVFDQARKSYLKALELNPDLEATVWNLAQCERLEGELRSYSHPVEQLLEEFEGDKVERLRSLVSRVREKPDLGWEEMVLLLLEALDKAGHL